MKLYYLVFILIISCIKNPVGNKEIETTIQDNSSWLIKINDFYCAFNRENKTMLFPIDSVDINTFYGIIEY